MAQASCAVLTDRAVVAVSGTDAHHFMQNLVTCDLDKVPVGGAAYGALLTPQGKIQFDFIAFAIADGFLLDLPKMVAADLIKRLTIYRLRAAVEITDRSDEYDVVAAWGGDAALPTAIASSRDPRLAALGIRAIVAKGGHVGANADVTAYARHRIGLGVPEAGIDFAYGEAFPHDADLDQLGGVAFDKGCFVGQEVVSRMEHRGTARRRVVQVRSDGELQPGAEIVAGDQTIGTIGSVDGASALALIRLDRAAAAADAGIEANAGGRRVELSIPQWARFSWPAAADNESG
jgi:folate-binding protein YgfZ